MRLVTCSYRNGSRLGVVRGDEVLIPAPVVGMPLEYESVLALIDAGPEVWRALQQLVENAPNCARAPLSGIALHAPVPRPHKNVMCLGWNYFDHARESAAVSGRAAQSLEHPIVFTKNVTSVTGPYNDISAHAGVTQQLDWEVELGVVIGIGGRDIPESGALEHVFGYTVINDVSARDLQFRHKQYFLGKSLDGACPMGPWIVTADEISDPQNLRLRSWVNGTLKQDATTRDMVFGVARIIAILSRGMTLEPGDIIATGTPAGVGFARNPPEYLKPGDVVECEVEGVGRLRNHVVG